MLAPWDGPAAIVFADGKRVGTLIDRNGLRPAAFAVTRDRLVAVASEAGAVPFAAADTIRRGRLGPGELLLVEPGRRAILEDTEAKAWALRSLPIHDAPRPLHEDSAEAAAAAIETRAPLDHAERYLVGLDAERARLDIKTMALEAHEPLWSMGDDTPTPGRGRLDRPVADHLRQAFAQVTNPAIDPERERIVMDLRVELGRRPALLGGPPRGPRTLRLERPIVADLEGLLVAPGRRRAPPPSARRDLAGQRRRGRAWPAPWSAWRPTRSGRPRPVSTSCSSATRACRVDRLAVPSILAAGVVHTALTAAGLRGRTDVVVDAADILDVHAMAMVLAVGATAAHPRLALELAAELAGTRGAETLTAADAIDHVVKAFEAGLRKTLARMGISAVASYIGGSLVDTIDLAPEVVARCFPMAAAWPGRTTLADLGDRALRRRAAALALPPTPAGREPRLPDPGFARFRADGEAHLFAPKFANEIQVLSGSQGGRDDRPRGRARRGPRALSDRARTGRGDAVRPARRAAHPPDDDAGAADRGRGRPRDRPPVRRLGDERRGALARRRTRPSRSGSSAPAGPRTPARAARTRRGTARAPTAAATTPASSRSLRRGSA